MAVLLNGTNGLIQAYDYQTPSTGFSYTFAAGTQTLVLNPSTTLATGTITMPPNPSDGMTITITSTQQITALTLSGNTGQTVNNATTFIAAASATSYVYRASNTTWFPFDSIPQLLNVPIGVGQTWQNVTGSRASGTTYTNSTGRPICVSLGVNCSGAGVAYAYVYINGSSINYVGQGSGASPNTLYSSIVQFIVPAGNTYSIAITGGLTVAVWAELR